MPTGPSIPYPAQKVFFTTFAELGDALIGVAAKLAGSENNTRTTAHNNKLRIYRAKKLDDGVRFSFTYNNDDREFHIPQKVETNFPIMFVKKKPVTWNSSFPDQLYR